MLPLWCNAQSVFQTISSAGHSVVTNSGIKVSQSIGQASVIGTVTQARYAVKQGLLNPLSAVVKTPAKVVATSLQVYPNPFNEALHFKASASGQFLISIFDASGRLVYKQETQLEPFIYTLPLSNLPSGSYTIQLQSHDLNLFFKRIKS